MAHGIGRRRLFQQGGLATAGAMAAGVPLPARPAGRDPVPADARPGGAYDRYVARLAADGRFSGVVLLSHRGRTVLSRAYGLADEQRGIRHHEGIAFTLSSAGKPFNAVAVLQLAQRGRLDLSDPIDRYLTGFPAEYAGRVTVHHLLSGASGLNTPEEDVERVFRSSAEVHAYQERWARQARLVGTVGLPEGRHAGAETVIPALIVEAVSGLTYWDYVTEHIFRRCGMTGSGFFTRPRWLTDPHLAHPYLAGPGGGYTDAVRNLDVGSSDPNLRGRNPGRAFIDAIGDGGFATAPDLARFAHALTDGTLLDRPWADVLLAARTPLGPATFGTYGPPASIVGGRWAIQRAGADAGVCANWSVYPDTGWAGVILANHDGVPLPEMIGRETQAVTGVAPSDTGAGG